MPAKNPLVRKMVIPADPQDLVDAMLVGLRTKAQVGEITVSAMVDNKPMVDFKEYVVCARNSKDELIVLSGIEASPYRDPTKVAAAQAKKLEKRAEKAAKKLAEKAVKTTSEPKTEPKTEPKSPFNKKA